MQRHSKQRDIVLSDLQSRYDHPTAEMVYQAVRNEMPTISLGTVYRNLNNLTEENVIQCFTLDGKDHFDGNATPHIHLCCTVCGQIEDKVLSSEYQKILTSDLTDVRNIIIQGKCKKCAALIKS